MKTIKEKIKKLTVADSHSVNESISAIENHESNLDVKSTINNVVYKIKRKSKRKNISNPELSSNVSFKPKTKLKLKKKYSKNEELSKLDIRRNDQNSDIPTIDQEQTEIQPTQNNFINIIRSEHWEELKGFTNTIDDIPASPIPLDKQISQHIYLGIDWNLDVLFQIGNLLAHLFHDYDSNTFIPFEKQSSKLDSDIFHHYGVEYKILTNCLKSNTSSRSQTSASPQNQPSAIMIQTEIPKKSNYNLNFDCNYKVPDAHYPYMKNLPPSIPDNRSNSIYVSQKKSDISYTNDIYKPIKRNTNYEKKSSKKYRLLTPFQAERLNISEMERKRNDSKYSKNNTQFCVEPVSQKRLELNNDLQNVEKKDDDPNEDSNFVEELTISNLNEDVDDSQESLSKSDSISINEKWQYNLSGSMHIAPSLGSRTTSIRSYSSNKDSRNSVHLDDSWNNKSNSVLNMSVKLGYLGPDKDNDDYKLKMQMKSRQKAYAESIRKTATQRLLKSSNKSTPGLSRSEITETPIEDKLPRISSSNSDLNNTIFSKREKVLFASKKLMYKMKKYCESIKKPAFKKPQLSSKLPPINLKTKTGFTNLDLCKMEKEHLSSMRDVENIRKQLNL